MLLWRKLQKNASNSFTTFGRYLGLIFGDNGDIFDQWVRFSELFKFQGKGNILWTQLIPDLSPIKPYQTWQPGQTSTGLIRAECWRNVREIGVCEVTLNQHDLEPLPRRSLCLPRGRKTNTNEEKLGKPLQATAVGNATVSVGTGLFRSDVSHQATFRAIPCAKLSWQSWWLRLGGKISGIFWSCPGFCSSCVFSWRFGS